MSKSVLIAGASGGFGLHLCEEFLRAGYRVFALSRKPIERHSSQPDRLIPIIGDVTQDSVGNAIAESLEKHGAGLDLLINNAGIKGGSAAIASVESADIEALFQTHCLGALRCAQASLPYLLKAKQAAIVNVSSRMGSISLINDGKLDHLKTSYAMRISKAALNMLSACLHRELIGTGVCVYTIHPGQLKTKMGHRDAQTEPADAAREFVAWLSQDPPPQNGSFYQPAVGSLPW